MRRDIREAFDKLIADSKDMGSPRYRILTKDEIDDLVGFSARVDQSAGEQDFPMTMIATIFALTMEAKMGGPNRDPGFLSEKEYMVLSQLNQHFVPLVDAQGLMPELERIYEGRNLVVTRGITKLSKDDKIERFRERKGRELYDQYGASKVFSTKTKNDN